MHYEDQNAIEGLQHAADERKRAAEWKRRQLADLEYTGSGRSNWEAIQQWLLVIGLILAIAAVTFSAFFYLPNFWPF